MIFESVLLPALLQEPAPGGRADVLHYNWAIHALQEIVESGIILTDNRGVLYRAIEREIKSWPPKYRMRAIQCLIQLERKNRIIEIEIPDNSNFDEDNCCGLALLIAQSRDHPPVILAPGDCRCMVPSECPASLPQACNFYDASILSFIRERRDMMAVVHDRRELERGPFEAMILTPILRHAKYVTLVDRVIGRSAFGLDPVEVPRRFRNGIEWILDEFVSSSSSPRGFTIYTEAESISTGLVDAVKAAKERRRAEMLRNFAEYANVLERRHAGAGISVKIVIKDPRRREESMNHDRYLITDQFGFLFTRGFDLLDDARAFVEDGAVFKLPFGASSKVIAAVTGLPDAR